MLIMATVMGANHIAARIAFDHGVNVTTAVSIRSGVTALAVLALLLAYRVPLAMPGATLRRAIGIGVLVAGAAATWGLVKLLRARAAAKKAVPVAT